MKIYPNFTAAIQAARQRLIDVGIWVHGDQWQSIDVSKKPEMIMRETLNFSLQVPVMGESLKAIREDIKPNLPWADDHFEERVGQEPINPGKQWKFWPWGNKANEFRGKNGQFSHTYMERFWPKWAGMNEDGKLDTPMMLDGHPVPLRGFSERWGIRYRYGDLQDVVKHLHAHPLSRQAYLPIWFPEDTGVAHGERVPCTLGYHFIHREGYLHTVYYIRSCDVVRHFQDDIYLAVRLKLWLLAQLRELDSKWKKVAPGFFTMHITSLHMFKADWHKHVDGRNWRE